MVRCLFCIGTVKESSRAAHRYLTGFLPEGVPFLPSSGSAENETTVQRFHEQLWLRSHPPQAGLSLCKTALTHFSQVLQLNVGRADKQVGNLTCRIYNFKLKRNFGLNVHIFNLERK